MGSLRTGKPRSADDRYRVGAASPRPSCRRCQLQLEAEGRLSLDDTVEKWLPGTVQGNGNDGTKVTVRQLLNHTSGIYNYTQDDDFGRAYFTKDSFFRHRYDTKTPADLVAIAMSHKPDFAPGTSWHYSNTNYVLAGMVIQKVTGQPVARPRSGDRIINPCT
ncbi:serine hydrolase domain-containing protein [Streptomyces sp. L7]